MATEGVDYAWSRPDIGQLAAAGKAFACRYGGPGSSGKQLDPGEAQALSAAGVAIVANAEGAADGLLGGWSAGADWARRADAHFRACGMPPDRPIYLSADFGVTSAQWPAVREALKGAASVIGAGRVGIYGGRRAIEWARRDGVAAWFWQTYAWSYGVWVPGNNIEQYQNGVSLAGATLDLDRALQSDFGQWTIGGDMGALEWIDPRVEALAHGMDTVRFGPEAGAPMETVQMIKQLVAAAAADETRDKALMAAIQALASGGTSIDTTAVIEAARAEGQATRELVEQRHQVQVAKLNETHAEILRERDAELAGMRAELDALKGASAS